MKNELEEVKNVPPSPAPCPFVKERELTLLATLEQHSER